MDWYRILLVTHVVLVMAGYVGLIATNAWLLTLCRVHNTATVAMGVQTWRRLARTFGPLLGLGVLAGFALAAVMHMPLTAVWLVATYALIVLALGVQGAVMVPWQLRAQAIAEAGGSVPVRPIVVVLTTLTIAYICIASLMLLRPA